MHAKVVWKNGRRCANLSSHVADRCHAYSIRSQLKTVTFTCSATVLSALPHTLTSFVFIRDCTFHTHIRLLNKRLTDRNLNNKIVNIVATAQSLINVTVKISVNKISIISLQDGQRIIR